MNNPHLFTPGPLNTSDTVRSSMNQDIGSRTPTLVNLTQNICADLLTIAECNHEFTCIPLQGSGTFAVEAMLTSLIGKEQCVLILSNGVYAERMITICQIHAINYIILSMNMMRSIDFNQVQQILDTHKNITHIAAVQFETALGVLNDMMTLIKLAENYHCSVLVDAMSTFGALPVDYTSPSLCAVAASANKCLHGVPGVSFVIARKAALQNSLNPRTLTLDLFAQCQAFEQNGEWRFTPPTHVLLAFYQALKEFKEAGGMPSRWKKYFALSEQLIQGFEAIDIHPLIEKHYRAPMITTFVLGKRYPFDVHTLYKLLAEQAIIIYASTAIPGKSFRVGCMGEIDSSDIHHLIQAIKEILKNIL